MFGLAAGTSARATTPPPPPPPEEPAPTAPVTTSPPPPPDTTEAPAPVTTESTAPPTTNAPAGPPSTEPPAIESSIPVESTLPVGLDETGTDYSSPIRLADGHVTRDIVFPVVGGYWLGSGWNDIRDAGARFHHGVDVIASAGQPVVSPVDGRITDVVRDHPSINNGITVTDDRGYSFRLFHMSSDMADDLSVGERVSAGQLLGYVGADQAIQHIHVELLRPSGVQINPLWSLDGARFDGYPCADPALVTDEWSSRPGMIVSPDDRQYVLSEATRCLPIAPPPPPPAPAVVTPRRGAAPDPSMVPA